MGRDKALLPFRGGVLVETVARAVEQAAGGVALVGGFGRYESLGYAMVADLYPGDGPLGGILTALAHSAADWNLIVACDMPGVSADFLAGLLDRAEREDAGALLPAGPSGRLEPLCAVYHGSSRKPLQDAFARGIRKVTAALGGLRLVRLPVPEAALFQNVNTPEDWAGYAAE